MQACLNHISMISLLWKACYNPMLLPISWSPATSWSFAWMGPSSPDGRLPACSGSLEAMGMKLWTITINIIGPDQDYCWAIWCFCSKSKWQQITTECWLYETPRTPGNDWIHRFVENCRWCCFFGAIVRLDDWCWPWFSFLIWSPKMGCTLVQLNNVPLQ